jgi:hypothetical protein
MKITIKSEKVLAAYNVVSTAKYAKLDDADKIKLWKIVRELKPVAEKLSEDIESAKKALEPEGYQERLQNAIKYEQMVRDPKSDMSECQMGAAEYAQFTDEAIKYRKLVSEATKELMAKEVEITFEMLSEESFCKLMSGNDWTAEQVVTLGDVIAKS